MPAQHGLRGIPWSRCDRCGLDYPLDMLSMQNGLLLDSKCLDDPIMWYRPAIQAEHIQYPPEEVPNITGQVRRQPNDEYWDN
jgi:hypothetical protein